jgi:hypothetical protein
MPENRISFRRILDYIGLKEDTIPSDKTGDVPEKGQKPCAVHFHQHQAQ